MIGVGHCLSFLVIVSCKRFHVGVLLMKRMSEGVFELCCVFVKVGEVLAGCFGFVKTWWRGASSRLIAKRDVRFQLFKVGHMLFGEIWIEFVSPEPVDVILESKILRIVASECATLSERHICRIGVIG